MSFLFCFLMCLWSIWVITKLFFSASNICVLIQNPGIGGSSIEQSSDLLWRISNIYVWNISIIFKILLFNMCFNFFAWFVKWTVIVFFSLTCSSSQNIFLLLNDWNRNWAICFSDLSKLKFRMASSLSKINRFASFANISV